MLPLVDFFQLIKHKTRVKFSLIIPNFKFIHLCTKDYLFKQEVEQEVKNLVTNEIDDDKEEEWGEERGVGIQYKN